MNTAPVFPLSSHLPWNVLKASIGTNYDGTHGNMADLCLMAGGMEDIPMIRVIPMGTNPASMMRFFINNGLPPGTPANNQFLFDVPLPATTASATDPQPILCLIEELEGYTFPPGYLLRAGVTTDLSASAGWGVIVAGRRFDT